MNAAATASIPAVGVDAPVGRIALAFAIAVLAVGIAAGLGGQAPSVTPETTAAPGLIAPEPPSYLRGDSGPAVDAFPIPDPAR